MASVVPDQPGSHLGLLFAQTCLDLHLNSLPRCSFHGTPVIIGLKSLWPNGKEFSSTFAYRR